MTKLSNTRGGDLQSADKAIEEILYAFSNYWREGAHDQMPPGDYLTPSQARKALQSYITNKEREARIDELKWVQKSYLFPDSNDKRVFNIGLNHRIRELKQEDNGGSV